MRPSPRPLEMWCFDRCRGAARKGLAGEADLAFRGRRTASVCRRRFGLVRADPQTPFETAMGATVLPHLKEIKPDRFLPSSRSVAFHRVAWRQSTAIPSGSTTGEDLVFDFRLRALYGQFPLCQKRWSIFDRRGTLRAFFKQYYHYAHGDGKADLWAPAARHPLPDLTLVAAAGFGVLAVVPHALVAAGAAGWDDHLHGHSLPVAWDRCWPLMVPSTG